MNSAFCLSRLFQSRSVKNECCFTSKALPVEMKGDKKGRGEVKEEREMKWMKTRPGSYSV